MQNWPNDANWFTEKTEWPSSSPHESSGAPCWKSTINFSWSLRRLMSWKSPCRPSGKSCHKNTSTRRWRTSPSVWLPTWLWLLMMVTSSICSNSFSFLSLTNWLFLEPPTDYQWRQRFEMPRNGGCLGWCSIILSFLPRCMECRRGLAMRSLSVCPSVRLSVCLSVKRVDCDKTKEKSVQIFISYETSFILVFWKNGWWGNPVYLKFWINRHPVGAKSPILNR